MLSPKNSEKGHVIKPILTAVQIIALTWSALVLILYVSIPLNLFHLLPEPIKDICTTILFFGIWGAPIASLLTAPLLLIYRLRTKSEEKKNNKLLNFIAFLVPIIITFALMFFELNYGEYLS